MTLWSGRVEGEVDRAVWSFLKADDAELLPHDAEATLTHARRLASAGIITAEELQEVETRLPALSRHDIAPEDEDVHTAIEHALGRTGRKLHAGRSRNDQVAAALRLLVGEACTKASASIGGLARTILERAEAEAETPMPGYTHLQRAQPVTVGHHLLAWVEMLERDLARFTFASQQAHVSPLGSGALAGSTLPLPPPSEGARNSLDAVADRDFALDYLYACAALFTHLSRMGEEVCLWVSAEFGFARLPETAATGSSMMPQKLNPDVAELARGKAGTALGRLAGFLATMKGLPLAYNRDLQEGTRLLVDARHDVQSALAALEVLVGDLVFDRERLAAACVDPLLLATDAAEELVEAGMPFRDAHEHVAVAVRTGRFVPPSGRPRPAPGPSGVAQAIQAARARLRVSEPTAPEHR
jgi:argininosuccinate lyase